MSEFILILSFQMRKERSNKMLNDVICEDNGKLDFRQLVNQLPRQILFLVGLPLTFLSRKESISRSGVFLCFRCRRSQRGSRSADIFFTACVFGFAFVTTVQSLKNNWLVHGS